MEYEHITHSFGPVYDENSRILILGTLPSVASRENNFYYGHKQNRFWKLLAYLLDEPVPETIDEKKYMLFKNHIAIWDVIQSCDIKGSSDSSIKNVEPTDIRKILETADIKQVYANGNKAGALYKKYQLPLTGMEQSHCRPQALQMRHGHLKGYAKHGHGYLQTFRDLYIEVKFTYENNRI